MFVLKNVWKKSIAALHRLTQDVQHSTRYPKTHVGGPDLDHWINHSEWVFHSQIFFFTLKPELHSFLNPLAKVGNHLPYLWPIRKKSELGIRNWWKYVMAIYLKTHLFFASSTIGISSYPEHHNHKKQNPQIFQLFPHHDRHDKYWRKLCKHSECHWMHKCDNEN